MPADRCLSGATRTFFSVAALRRVDNERSSRPIWEASDAHWPATQQSPPPGRSAAAGVAAGCARALLARASMWSKAACLVERKKSFDLRKYTAEPALTDSTSSRCTLSENWSKGSPVSDAFIDRLLHVRSLARGEQARGPYGAQRLRRRRSAFNIHRVYLPTNTTKTCPGRGRDFLRDTV